MKLWDWAVAAYAQPGVEAALLDLQDHHDQCVCLLLWAVWSARTGRTIPAAELTNAAALAHAWESQVTRPLRIARRALARPWPGIADRQREALHGRAKDNELSAERQLLNGLESLTPKGPDAAIDLGWRLRAAAAAWSLPAPVAALDRLVQIFETLDV